MRKVLFLLLCISSFLLNAAKVELPAVSDWSWHYYYTADLPDGLFAEPEVLDGTLTLPDKRQIKAVKFDYPAKGMINLYTVVKPKPKVLERTIVTSDFNAPEAGYAIIGVGVDWKFKLYCNGKLLYDTTKFGNGAIPTSNNDHYVELPVKAGRNQLIWELFGGRDLFDLAVELKDIPQLNMRYEPWVIFPDSESNSVSIVFSFSRPAPAGVDYRIKGSEKWTRIYNDLGGQIRRDLSVHQIRLSDLKPGSEYEYRVVMIDETKGYAELEQKIYSFKTAPAVDSKKEFTFVAFSDVQFRPPQRKEAIKQLFNNKEMQASNFAAFIGDVDWTSNFDQTIIEEFVNYYLEYAKRDKPLMMVRGNHEIYGRDTNRYFSYFSAPEPGREGYYICRYGNVCFLVLDFCDDQPRCPAPSTRCLHNFDPYLVKESKWLKQVLESDMFKTAQFRIVLSHAIPLGHGSGYMPENVRKMIDPLLSTDGKYKIHLWIGGHVHRPFRSIPLHDSCYSAPGRDGKPLNFAHPAIGGKYAFPVITMGGPNGKIADDLQLTHLLVKVKDGELDVSHRDWNHKVFDRIVITPDGKVKELERADWFAKRDY